MNDMRVLAGTSVVELANHGLGYLETWRGTTSK
jgi:hypothetical protein